VAEHHAGALAGVPALLEESGQRVLVATVLADGATPCRAPQLRGSRGRGTTATGPDDHWTGTSVPWRVEIHTPEVNMRRRAAIRQLSLLAFTCASLALASTPAAAAKDPPPEISPEGLQLKKSTRNRLVYVKPGATFAQYGRISILDPLVEFEKDWQKDYNRSQTGLAGRVTDADVEKMKERLAAEFKKIFIAELQGDGGYQVVDVAGPDVLVLRPALLNVEVNAPDVMTAGIEHTVVRSAGQMTLYLELWDSTSNTLLARVMDAQADPDSMAQMGGSVTNKAAADRILRKWAKELRERLDDVRGKPAGQ
jgi:hypothetical protein